jgi:hypothetical protein
MHFFDAGQERETLLCAEEPMTTAECITALFNHVDGDAVLGLYLHRRVPHRLLRVAMRLRGRPLSRHTRTFAAITRFRSSALMSAVSVWVPMTPALFNATSSRLLQHGR